MCFLSRVNFFRCLSFLSLSFKDGIYENPQTLLLACTTSCVVPKRPDSLVSGLSANRNQFWQPGGLALAICSMATE